MQKIIDFILNLQLYEIILLVPLFLIIYFIIGIYLDKLNNQIYNKSTILAWIPLARIILASKLTIHYIVGWLIIFMYILSSNFTIKIGNYILSKNIPSQLLSNIIFYILTAFVIGLYVYVIFKSIMLKKTKTTEIKIEKTNTTTNTVLENSIKKPEVEEKPTEEPVINDLGNTILVPTITFEDQELETPTPIQEENSESHNVVLEQNDVKELDDKTEAEINKELNAQALEAIEALKKLQV